jgi:UDP-N-acetylmuramoyl-tripeptide--D-alanyl-D-alanine ligase
MRSALETLARLKSAGRNIAILGDMGELGDASEKAHRQVGQLAAELRIDRLFLLGEKSRWVAEEALAGGMEAGNVHLGNELEKIAQSVRELVQAGDWVLVKGSRAMQMERLVNILAAEETN